MLKKNNLHYKNKTKNFPILNETLLSFAQSVAGQRKAIILERERKKLKKKSFFFSFLIFSFFFFYRGVASGACFAFFSAKQVPDLASGVRLAGFWRAFCSALDFALGYKKHDRTCKWSAVGGLLAGFLFRFGLCAGIQKA
jgi:hypothetical protein